MRTQIRIYTINRGQLHQFATEWREKIVPLRRQLGFTVPAAWLVEETGQFVWLLSHEDGENWGERDRAYYASPARRALDPDPARLIARAEEYFAMAIAP